MLWLLERQHTYDATKTGHEKAQKAQEQSPFCGSCAFLWQSILPPRCGQCPSIQTRSIAALELPLQLLLLAASLSLLAIGAWRIARLGTWRWLMLVKHRLQPFCGCRCLCSVQMCTECRERSLCGLGFAR